MGKRYTDLIWNLIFHSHHDVVSSSKLNAGWLESEWVHISSLSFCVLYLRCPTLVSKM